jgi:hypothetical protein
MEPDISGADTQETPKAVLVAQDVLDRLDHLSLTRGHYLYGYPDKGDINPDGDLRDNVKVIEQICSICALGALLLSKARLFDDVPMTNVLEYGGFGISTYRINMTRGELTAKLRDAFSDEQLDLIETAFERRYIGSNCTRTKLASEALSRAIRFGEAFYNNTERLKAIMENVIANNGVFVPPRLAPERGIVLPV